VAFLHGCKGLAGSEVDKEKVLPNFQMRELNAKASAKYILPRIISNSPYRRISIFCFPDNLREKHFMLKWLHHRGTDSCLQLTWREFSCYILWMLNIFLFLPLEELIFVAQGVQENTWI